MKTTERDEIDDLIDEVSADPEARSAMVENDLRRRIGASFEAARKEQGISIRDLAAKMGTSKSQVQRLLHHHLGGSLTLRTVVRAADVLGLAVGMHVRTRCEPHGKVVSIGRAGWTSCPGKSTERLTPRTQLSVPSKAKTKHWAPFHAEPETPLEKAGT
jgi:transcriptional regulator with XRE-family HTH domain